MKLKGGRRKSWEGLPESASMAEDFSFGGNSQTNPLFLNPSLSAPSLLALDSQHPSDSLHRNLDSNPEPEPEPDEPEPEPEPEPDEAHDGEEEEEEEEDDDGDGDENAERPKLDEGFYEIEAIRRKRVRKGQLQYLIKWRGWPETSNTWEPVENLQSCSDVIEAFEESMRSGKRKRKRKSGILHTHVKKRHQRNPIPIYNNTGSEIVNVNPREIVPSTVIDNAGLSGLSGFPQTLGYSLHDCNGGVNNNGETSKKSKAENGLANVLRRSSGRRGNKEYDPKLSELKTTPPVTSPDKLAIHFQEAKASEGNNGLAESPKVQSMEPVQSSTRSTGAKRRKSGSVKRFKQEPQLFDAAVMQNLTLGTDFVSGCRTEMHGEGYPIVAAENLNHRDNSYGPENALRITKILKPIAYSASVIDGVQDVKVTFQVMRSDGMEVAVDNKFLRANYPHLLINYYEQHLRYNPSL